MLKINLFPNIFSSILWGSLIHTYRIRFVTKHHAYQIIGSLILNLLLLTFISIDVAGGTGAETKSIKLRKQY